MYLFSSFPLLKWMNTARPHAPLAHSSPIAPARSSSRHAGLRLATVFFLLVLLIAGTAPFMTGSALASGTTLYVSPLGGSAGPCSLTAPCDLTRALSIASSGDTIGITGNVQGNINLGAFSNLTLEGVSAGARLGPANSAYSTITIPSGTVATIENLIVLPGVPEYGGAIYNSGRVNLVDATIGQSLSSHLTTTPGASFGGGIYNAGNASAVVVGSTIAGITAQPFSLAITPSGLEQGVGILNDGSMTVRNSTIADNIIGTGTVFQYPLMQGGGIFNGGSLTLLDSTVAGTALSIVNGASPTVVGGGIYNVGTMTMVASTIAGNLSGPGATGATISGAGIYSDPLSSGSYPGVAAAASIVAGNGPSGTQNCASGGVVSVLDSLGFNVTNTPAAQCGLTMTNDQPNSSPDLGSLSNNGGTAYTMLPGSTGSGNYVIPADMAVASPFSGSSYTLCPGYDERGYVRPAPGESQCSVGAVEPGSSPPAPPQITSAAATTFTVGSQGTFTVAATGVPSGPTLTLSDGGATLPSGVTFHDNGNGTATLAGTPAAGTGKVYTFTITASNGVSPSAVQTFTLTVNQAPAITSAASTTFTVGSRGTFTVAASGFPAGAALTLSDGGATLPSGVTFHDNGNGTATLAGTPAAGIGKVYTFTITASNGVSPSAVQTFTLTCALQGVVLSVQVRPTAAVLGSPVTITAAVASNTGGGSTPTGTVSFADAPIAGCQDVPLVRGTATCTTSGLPLGTDHIHATYSGNSLFAAAVAAATVEVVAPASASASVPVPATGVGPTLWPSVLLGLLLALGGVMVVRRRIPRVTRDRSRKL